MALHPDLEETETKYKYLNGGLLITLSIINRMEQAIKRPEKIKLTEINPYLTCYLCKGYFIDATTISECLHSFCRSCIIKFLQDNSYCPVCEVIINKAKPNLKLDKTLQDIVYKLVPELFLREMTRRKQYYQQYPQIAARVSPEERGEDIERTIFHPQDCISLSMEYISADSSPGAIKLFGWRNGSDKNGPLTPEENQALMKRYLQCPGMCRVEVLKKFVRNKYNVDTSLFHIDMLYKRVPLPDHYTLIDIAYIYSWKRNEPMKFFFRITDINKVSERFDYFNSQNPMDFVVKTPVRAPRNNGERTGSNKKREHKKNSKINKQASPKKDVCDDNKSEHNDSYESIETNRVTVDKSECDKIDDNDKNSEKKVSETKIRVEKVTATTDSECSNSSIKIGDAKKTETYLTVTDKLSIKPEKAVSTSDELNKSVVNDVQPLAKEWVEVKNEVPLQDAIPGQMKTEINGKGEIKKAVYTNITLNRTNNVEIITKIQKVSNKAGQAIGLNIIKQTVKSNTPVIKPTKKVSSCRKAPQSKTNKSASKSHVSKKLEIPSKTTSSAASANKNINIESNNDASSSVCNLNNNEIKQKPESPPEWASTEDVEKRRFLESIELTARNVQSAPEQKTEPGLMTNGQKRKLASPVKSESTIKKPKLDKKPTTRIILSKPKQAQQPSVTKPSCSSLQSRGLKSLIESCKIPSSLSITLKDSTENNRMSSSIPPVKNFIEILKLPDENGQQEKPGKDCPTSKLDFNMKMCDNDSEQKVDEDLAQIAKSLTERIPMSTTISEIVGPKPQFPIPVKTNVPLKFIQPSPVPELSNKILNVTKDNKLNPRSPQTFQKIFEQSIKTPEEESKSAEKSGQKSALDLSNDSAGASTISKRNLSEIASQLSKKTKMEQENNIFEGRCDDSSTPKPAPKVPIPRLPNQRTLKPPQKNLKFELSDPMKFQQTLTNLHSNALGLNYTISVGHNVPMKVNGLVPPIKQEAANVSSGSPGNLETRQTTFASPRDISTSSPRPSPIPRNLSPAMGYNSPRNSPKHSPKSSPMIKHMYAPVPNLMMDQLRVNTYTQRVPSPKVNTFNKSPKSSPQLPSSSANLPSPSKHPVASPASSPKLPASSTKSLACSPKPPASSPKPPASSPKTPASSPSPLVFSPKPPSLSPIACSSPKMSPNAQASTSGLSVSSMGSPKQSSVDDQSSPLSPNQILEKYNIQNLAQLSASLNFNATNNFGMNPNNQLAAIQHAMLLKRFEMQNRQNWLNMNQGPLLQYEKYLQSLKNNHLLSNMKEN